VKCPGKPKIEYESSLPDQLSNLKAGMTLIANIEVKAAPLAKITWYSAGKEVSPVLDVTIESDGTFSR
jgi:hypothetical protein